MMKVTVAERRARVGARHRVAPRHRAVSVNEVAQDLVCLHATDPASVYLSAWSRLREPSHEAVDEALYRDRDVVRMLAMRRTMFVVAVEEIPVLHAATSKALARRERKRNEDYAALLDDVVDAKRWLREAESETLAFLHEHGEASAQELSAALPALARKVRVSAGKKYEGDIGMSSRILIVLALEGLVVRGCPRGTWLSTQYRWATVEDWLGAPMAEVPVEKAQATLIERWLGRFGPGTEQDVRWWTGLTAREVRVGLASIGAVEVDLDGEKGYLLPDDLAPTPPLETWVALLPSLDPTTMGWQSRDWYLGAHKPAIFDSMGNAGPTIWCDGRIVGGWAIRAGGSVATQAPRGCRQRDDRRDRSRGRTHVAPARCTAGLSPLPVTAPQRARPQDLTEPARRASALGTTARRMCRATAATTAGASPGYQSVGCLIGVQFVARYGLKDGIDGGLVRAGPQGSSGTFRHDALDLETRPGQPPLEWPCCAGVSAMVLVERPEQLGRTGAGKT